MTSFWLGLLIDAALMPTLMIVVLGCFVLWWKPVKKEASCVRP